MNRAERRQKERQGITAQDLKKFERDIGVAATRFAVEGYTIAVAAVLFDKQGMPKEEARKLLDQVAELFDSIMTDYATLEDWKKVLNEEYDFVLDTDVKKGEK
jgi:uncharacterized protein YfbU (UPF0304 family)